MQFTFFGRTPTNVVCSTKNVFGSIFMSTVEHVLSENRRQVCIKKKAHPIKEETDLGGMHGVSR